jgi:hypothetical protein
MAWPKNLSAISTNMDESEFTLVRFAIDHELVEWGEGDLLIGYRTSEFMFNNKTYILAESYEVVQSINRKEN